jgi:hypothetical protein
MPFGGQMTSFGNVLDNKEREKEKTAETYLLAF